MPRNAPRRVATLWNLVLGGETLSCVVYRIGRGGALEMRLQSGAVTILSEPFELGPRALARIRALERSLKRRGWRDSRPAARR